MKISSNVYELIPTNGRKSFYGKAKVICAGGARYLRSYSTIVASIDDMGRIHRHSDYRSSTTNSHLISFLGRNEYNGFWERPVEKYDEIFVRV